MTNRICRHDISDGPTRYATTLFKWANDEWYDDQLTEAEEAFIVGTYSIPDSRGGTYTVSWWPPVSVFEDARAGENYGFWSDYNESGFVAREARIFEGKAKPLSRQEWKAQLRGLPQVRRWKASLKDRSEEYIAEHGSKEYESS